MAEERVHRHGFEIAARMGGGADGGPVILLSNSLGATMDMWDAQRPFLERRYRVIGYDARGHGASGTPFGPYSFDDLVGDALAVLDHFGVERASSMGLSLGGMTGLGLALAAPERVERLVVCDARADAPPPFAQSWDDRVAAIRAGGLETIWPGTLERWIGPRTRAARPELVERLRDGFLQTTVEGYAGCAAALRHLDYFRRLGEIAVPTLYVVGADDAGAPVATMRAMADATPGATLAVVPEAAHIANLDNPAGFEAAISPFLGGA